MHKVRSYIRTLFFLLLFSNVSVGMQADWLAKFAAFWQQKKFQKPHQQQVRKQQHPHPPAIQRRKNAWRGARGLQPGIVPTVGLINGGALCYQNATLQAIHKCPVLKTALVNKIESNLNHLSSPLITGLHDILTQLDGHGYTYDPSFLANQASHVIFDDQDGQQDAQEFLAGLWSHFQAQHVLPDTTPPAGAAIDPACSAWAGLALRKHLKCHDCKQSRYAPTEMSFIMPLTLQPRTRHIETLILQLQTPQKLTNEEKVDCANCHTKTDHTEQITFQIAPEMRYLVLHIKRFQGWPADKIKTPIVFFPSGIVEIVDAISIKHRFLVTSIVVHSGDLGFGHYKCITRDGIYNDSHVRLDDGVAMQTLLKNGEYDRGQGYLYFLQRLAD